MRDGIAFDSFCFRVDLLPVIQDFYDEFDHEGIFAGYLRGNLFEGYLHDDSDDVCDLLYPGTIQRTSFQDFYIVFESFSDNFESLFDVGVD